MSSTQGIDYAKLTLQDALDLAILIEEEACDRYQEFAAQMEMHRTPEAGRFFRLMAGNEEKHRAELAERRFVLFKDAPGRVTRAHLFDVEAPEYDEARAFMTAREALQAALRCEEKAHAFFVAALPAVRDPGVKKLFEELREEEVEHQDLVKRELAKLPPEGKMRRADVADEPTAQ